jgi:cysteine-S-conjugate beta-lyase
MGQPGRHADCGRVLSVPPDTPPGKDLATQLAHVGRDPARQQGAVNPAIQRGSTVVAPTPDDLYRPGAVTYGREGFQAHRDLEAALCAVEGGAGATLAPSGLGACTLALLSVAQAGKVIFVSDSIYGPTRRFCDTVLARLGIETVYYDPRAGAGLAAQLHDGVGVVMVESPGSMTLEIQDIPAVVHAARAVGATTVIDNTWSAGIVFKPFDHGIDLSIQAVTKYQAGHADAFLGAVLAATPALDANVRGVAKAIGLAVAPEDVALALRGLRTLPLRFQRQADTGLQVARWLAGRPEVARVLHPALQSHPDHALWQRDFKGASGLFSVVLQPTHKARVDAFLQALHLFALGFSWGGYESLVLPCDPQIKRTAAPWRAPGPLLRFSIGLEAPQDLIADLESGFAAMPHAAGA